MANRQPIEIFMPPNMLKAKVGSVVGGIDMAAVKRAESAMDGLKSEFTDWLASDVTRLAECRDKLAKSPNAATRADLFRAAHDLKGQAATYEYPMIARIASSLTKLIESTDASRDVSLGLIDAHVAAIRVVFRDKIQSTTDMIAKTLTEELEARVTETLAAA
jgi:chemotaxis protein histidine kinase CheA